MYSLAHPVFSAIPLLGILESFLVGWVAYRTKEFRRPLGFNLTTNELENVTKVAILPGTGRNQSPELSTKHYFVVLATYSSQLDHEIKATKMKASKMKATKVRLNNPIGRCNYPVTVCAFAVIEAIQRFLGGIFDADRPA